MRKQRSFSDPGFKESGDEKDQFDRLPRHTWHLFTKGMSRTSLFAFRKTHPKFTNAFQKEINKYHGNAFFCFLFDLKEDEATRLFQRLPIILKHYFDTNLTTEQCTTACEKFIRDNDHYETCLYFQEALMPKPLEDGKWYRGQCFFGEFNTVLMNHQQIATILTLLTFRCVNKKSAWCSRFINSCIVLPTKDPEDFHRLVNVFLDCVNHLTSMSEPKTQPIEYSLELMSL